MPSTAALQDQVIEVVVQVLGCEPDDVVPEATLAELGADSLTVVEIGEGLGQRFDRYLSDATIDSMTTVQDAIDAVSTPAAAPLIASSGPVDLPLDESEPALALAPDVEKKAWRSASWLAVTGILVGGVIGLLLTGLVGASGLGGVDLPPLPSSDQSTTPTPTPTPTPTQTTRAATPQPTLAVDKPQVGPGERFTLSGRFPQLGADAQLDIQFRENKGAWQDFPVDAVTRGQGQFKVELYTSRTGPREFRVRHAATGETTPVVAVTIG